MGFCKPKNTLLCYICDTYAYASSAESAGTTAAVQPRMQKHPDTSLAVNGSEHALAEKNLNRFLFSSRAHVPRMAGACPLALGVWPREAYGHHRIEHRKRT